jgi:hypothetical protein
MDPIIIVLIVLLVVFLFGGLSWPAPVSGTSPVAALLYLLVAVVLIVLALRITGALV